MPRRVNNLSILTKLTILIGFMSLSVIAVGVVSLHSLKQMDDAADAIQAASGVNNAEVKRVVKGAKDNYHDMTSMLIIQIVLNVIIGQGIGQMVGQQGISRPCAPSPGRCMNWRMAIFRWTFPASSVGMKWANWHAPP